MAVTKTRKVAVFPDGSRHPLTKTSGLGWRYPKPCFGPSEFSTTSYSSHQWPVIEAVEEAGGHIEVEPNPNYRPRLTTFERLTRGMAG